MSLPIVVSPSSRKSLFHIIQIIKEKWGKQSSDKFKLQTIKTLKNLSSQPYIFKASSLSTDVRKGMISKQTSFFYQVHQNHIEILFFVDNRQEPLID